MLLEIDSTADLSAVSADLTWSFQYGGTITFPKAPAGDYYIVETGYGFLIPRWQDYHAYVNAYASTGFDPRHVVPWQFYNDGSDSYGQTPVDGYEVPADRLTGFDYAIDLYASLSAGNDAYFVGNYGVGNAASIEFYVQRFHADGTPDNFTPEPASIALTFGGITGVMLLRRGRRA